MSCSRKPSSTAFFAHWLTSQVPSGLPLGDAQRALVERLERRLDRRAGRAAGRGRDRVARLPGRLDGALELGVVGVVMRHGLSGSLWRGSGASYKCGCDHRVAIAPAQGRAHGRDDDEIGEPPRLPRRPRGRRAAGTGTPETPQTRSPSLPAGVQRRRLPDPRRAPAGPPAARAPEDRDGARRARHQLDDRDARQRPHPRPGARRRGRDARPRAARALLRRGARLRPARDRAGARDAATART